MADPAAQFAPSEIDLILPFGTIKFRLPPVRIARLQQARGIKLTYPDGATGVRPKPIGAIVREHLVGVNGDVTALVVDSYLGEYDAEDSREVIVQGMIGGGMEEHAARLLVVEQVDPWPLEEKWKLATAILVACAQGYVPPVDPGAEDAGNAEAAGATTSSTSPPPSET